MPDFRAPLQLLPQGLLGFLQLKNGGQAPQFLLEGLQPSLELQPWYVESNAEILSANAVAVAGAGITTSGIVVPQDEYWWLLDYFVEFVFGAGATVSRFQGAVRYNVTQVSFPVADGPALVANDRARTSQMVRPVLLQPGGELVVYVGAVTGFPQNANFGARIARCPA